LKLGSDLTGAFVDAGDPANATVVATAASFRFCASSSRSPTASRRSALALCGLQDIRVPML